MVLWSRSKWQKELRNCMAQFDLNFKFGGQTTDSEVSVQEENEPATERTRFIALQQHELNQVMENA